MAAFVVFVWSLGCISNLVDLGALGETMIEQRSFRLPLPPSLNRTYKTGRGNFYKSPEARAWEVEAGYTLNRIQGLPNGRYEVVYTFHFEREGSDLANREKVLSDVMVKHGIISDDRFIDEMYLQRGPKAKPGYVDIVVTLLNK